MIQFLFGFLIGQTKTQDLEERIAVRGGNITLKCQLESGSGQRFWLFSSESQKVTKTISFQNDTFLDGASVKITKKSEYQLIINEIQQTEDGEWYCQENDRTVKSYRLYVDVAPYIDPLNISVVRKGEDATLICRSSGKPRPELVWKFQNRTLNNFTDTTNLKSRNGQERIQSTLTVKSIKDNILQQYSCTAKNRAASVTKKADIFIKETPKILKENQLGYEEFRYAKIGDEVRMICISKGYPNPKIAWTAPTGQYSEDDNDKKSKYSVCVQRQNHEKFGHMTVAYLGSFIIIFTRTVFFSKAHDS